MTPAELKQGRVLVVGLGISGASVVRFLEREGVAFDAVDTRGASGLALPPGTRLYTDLETALEMPVDVLVLSPGIPRDSAGIRAALADGARVIGDIELFACAVQHPVVAVTGSNGKSTVVAWLAYALRRVGIRALACGNIGDAALDALDADAAEAIELYVLELSSYQLESTSRLRPLVATVLNVSEDHLDRYASFEHYAQTKRRIHAGASHVVANAADANTWPLRPLDRNDALLDVRAAEPTDSAPVPCWQLGRAANDNDARDPQAWLYRDDVALLPQARLRLPGRHNAFNALAVLALAQPVIAQLRADDAEATGARLLEALGEWAGLAHRTEFVVEADGVRWYDDSKGTNVEACKRAIEAMPGPVNLIAGGLGKGADFSPLGACGEALRRVLLIGRDAPLLRRVFEPVTEVHDMATLEAAVTEAARLAQPGDVVLLSPACASFDMFTSYVERGERFKAAVRDTVSATAAARRSRPDTVRAQSRRAGEGQA